MVLYIGVTNDVENRLRQHIRGDSKFAALAGVSTNRNKDKKHPQLVSPPTEIMVK